MVKCVEGLSADREIEPFPDLEILEQVQVDIEIMRPTILVARLHRITWQTRSARDREVIVKQGSCVQQAGRVQTSRLAEVEAGVGLTATAACHDVTNDGRRRRRSCDISALYDQA